MQINRHLAARAKNKLAPLFRQAIAQGILTQDDYLLDMGCGVGADFNQLRQMGYRASGWDLYYYPLCCGCCHRPDIVSLNYVLNVIEDPQERRELLANSWQLCTKALLIALPRCVKQTGTAYADGRLNSYHCFNRAFETDEFYALLESVTGRLPRRLGDDLACCLKDDPAIELDNRYQLISLLHNEKRRLSLVQKRRLRALIRQSSGCKTIGGK